MTQVFCICTCVLYLYLWSSLWAETSGLFSVMVQLVGKRWVSVVWIDYTGICHHSRPGASDRAACVLFSVLWVCVCVYFIFVYFVIMEWWMITQVFATSDRKVCVFAYLCLYICIRIFVYVYLWINHTSFCICLKFRQWTKTQWLSSFWIFGLFFVYLWMYSQLFAINNDQTFEEVVCLLLVIFMPISIFTNAGFGSLLVFYIFHHFITNLLRLNRNI